MLQENRLDVNRCCSNLIRYEVSKSLILWEIVKGVPPCGSVTTPMTCYISNLHNLSHYPNYATDNDISSGGCITDSGTSVMLRGIGLVPLQLTMKSIANNTLIVNQKLHNR